MLGWAALAGEEARPAGGLTMALDYLGSRARARTPLGAAEYLSAVATFGPAAYSARVRLAVTTSSLYRDFFPEEYRASAAPPFSTGREHEFYRLVNANLFPLLPDAEGDLETRLGRDPDYFLPCIPLRGTQRHVWAGGCFDFRRIETVYKLAQVLAWMTGAGGRGWAALKAFLGLEGVPEPAPPLAAVGWSLFVYSCEVEGTPLRALPLAFKMISYRTGNAWLDLPPVGACGFDWTAEEVERLRAAWARRLELEQTLGQLDAWLDEDPRPRVARAVELWNKASEVEARTGHAGEYLADGTFMRATLPGDLLREVYGYDPRQAVGDFADQLAALRGETYAPLPALLDAVADTE